MNRPTWQDVDALLPFEDTAAREGLRAWYDYRRETTKPLVLSSWRRLVDEALADPRAFKAKVEHSISQGWTGLFAPKDAPKKAGPAPPCQENWTTKKARLEQEHQAMRKAEGRT